MQRMILFLVLGLVLGTASCGAGQRRTTSTGDASSPPAFRTAEDRCSALHVPEALKALGVDVRPKLDQSSIDSSIGLSCEFDDGAGLSVATYQYADDAEFRRDPLADYAAVPDVTRYDLVPGGAFGYPAFVQPGVGATGSLVFDVGTSRWKVVTTAPAALLGQVDAITRAVVVASAKGAATIGPLVVGSGSPSGS